MLRRITAERIFSESRPSPASRIPMRTIGAPAHATTTSVRDVDPRRYFDVLFSLCCLTLALPLLAVAALAVKLENPRAGVLFRQVRYGYRGQPFTIVKLRTMVPEAELMKSKLVSLSVDQGPGFKIIDDPRITRVGRWLRRTHIDEIPQFINVVKGDMSIVGPRPNSYSPDVYEPWQRIRLIVKPGLTGPWQIAREKPLSFEDRCIMDFRYIESKSFVMDAGIVLVTIWRVLTARNGC